MSRFVSLIFNYDLDKMVRSGRVWAKEGYLGKEHILEYSAASIATVLHHNPDVRYSVWTDDPGSLESAVKRYDVPLRSLDIVDAGGIIDVWREHEYCFWPALMHSVNCFLSDEPTIKLDNDLTCLKPCDDLFKHDGALVWKKERMCSSGRRYWGESYAAERAFGTADFHVHNIGVLALSERARAHVHDIPELCQSMLDVDISSIVKFPEDPSATTKVWSCSEQTAVSYFIHQRGLSVSEANDHFLHHCYEKSKQSCIEAAEFLKKR